MQTQNPLETLLYSAYPPREVETVSGTENQLRRELEKVDLALGRIKETKPSDFLPFESRKVMTQATKSRQELVQKHQVLRAQLAFFQTDQKTAKIRHEMHVHVARNGFPQQIDLTPLAASKYTGPVFMVSPFGNTSGQCRINIRLDHDSNKYKADFVPRLPRAIGAELQKACRDLVTYTKPQRYTQISITGEFAGTAGADTARVKRMVNIAAKRKVFDQIMVIAEAPEWQIAAVTPQRNLDPLIVGWVEKTEQMFFITAYDMTPVEKYFLDQFGYGVSY
jgi:hypothetical protein